MNRYTPTTQLLLTNPACVRQWRSMYPDNRGICLLQDYIDGKNRGLKARQDIHKSFKKIDSKFWWGLTLVHGFGCEQQATNGNHLIYAAALEGCSEAMNYLALCYLVSGKAALALELFHHAKNLGHPIARNNFESMCDMLQLSPLVDHRPKLLCVV